MHTGIDLGLKVTAITTLNDIGQIICKEHFGSEYLEIFKKVKHAPQALRLRTYYDYMCKYMESNNITGTIVIEEPMGRISGFGQQIIALKGVYTIAISNYIDMNKIFYPKPTEIKKFFTGSGAASKEMMIEECKVRGIMPRHDHEADSIAMAFMSIEGVL